MTDFSAMFKLFCIEPLPIDGGTIRRDFDAANGEYHLTGVTIDMGALVRSLVQAVEVHVAVQAGAEFTLFGAQAKASLGGVEIRTNLAGENRERVFLVEASAGVTAGSAKAKAGFVGLEGSVDSNRTMMIDSRATFQAGNSGSRLKIGDSFQSTWLANNGMTILEPKDVRYGFKLGVGVTLGVDFNATRFVAAWSAAQ